MPSLPSPIPTAKSSNRSRNSRDDETDRFDAGSRGARDAASLLPFIAIALFFPPIVLIFAKPATLFALPLIVVYLFAVWAIVIAAACLLSRRLGKSGPADDEPV